MGSSDPERLFLDHLPLLDRILGATARRHRLTREEAEDFASGVKLKLIADDYEVLRAFEGRSSLAGYLAAVVQRAWIDHCNHLWGKWRPSAEARRLGPLAVRLDTLLHRDGLTLEQACATVSAADAAAMRRLAERLPRRVRRRFAGDDELAAEPAAEPSPEAALLDRERDGVAAALGEALATEMERLPPEDRLLIQLRYFDDLTVASFARAMGGDAKRLYRRLETVLGGLRRSLERRGYDGDQVGWALGHGARSGEPPFDVRLKERDEANLG